ncbi:hypothetical protein PY093_17375 [Cytobacillus sp. S13-E01]|uniref:hypothetical protein n=1 Tax=Cytobacillus sp. S13-E01 TaxID=3031326 RepID=UPI0023D7DDE5|nr:hypothetical protein [Cytobacillus sp. S13-E01]MDF0728413.1 hypothetical protein [Cytobacillus sp. S13-E01]
MKPFYDSRYFFTSSYSVSSTTSNNAISIFSLVCSIGIITTSSFDLALESQGYITGSASALMGVLRFVLGSITSPLVAVAGEYSAIPMGVVILSASLLAMLAYFGLVRRASLQVQTAK